jgi:hypothetical protein
MIEIGLSLLVLGFCIALGALAVKVVRHGREIDELRDRADDHEDELMAIDPGWLP